MYIYHSKAQLAVFMPVIHPKPASPPLTTPVMKVRSFQPESDLVEYIYCR